MSAPAIIWLALVAFSALAAAHLHGTPRTGKHSLWVNLVSTAIGGGLFYWGGLFARVAA